MNIYSNLDYRSAIKNKLISRKKMNPKYTSSGLADAVQVQKPYISRVFKGDAHFSTDQLFLACHFLELSSDEREYLSLLLEWQRSVITSRRQELRELIKNRQTRARGSEEHLSADMVAGGEVPELAEYFLEPLAPLVHIFLTVPRYARSPHLIKQMLGMSESKFETTLKLLLRLKIIEFDIKAKAYQVLKDHIHLRRDSIFSTAYQLLFRQMSSEQIKRLEENDKFQFSVTITVDEETKGLIHEEFNTFIKRVESLVRSAPADGVYQMIFDLFRWDPPRSS